MFAFRLKLKLHSKRFENISKAEWDLNVSGVLRRCLHLCLRKRWCLTELPLVYSDLMKQ